MNYHVRRQGQSLGTFPLEELIRRRGSGQFTGIEYIQAEGTKDWQPLDLVLKQGYRTTPPPLPPLAARRGASPVVIWSGIAAGVILLLLFVIGVGIGVSRMQKDLSNFNQGARSYGLNQNNPKAVETAGRAIVWDQNTQSFADEQKRQREFRRRLWVEGYEKQGTRNPECDAEADLFIRTYVARNYGGNEASNSMSLADESDKLAADKNCTDPLVLTVAGDESRNLFGQIHCFQHALAAYPGSGHQAYPQLYATLRLVSLQRNSSDPGALETSALQLLKQCFSDGSFTTNDQQEIADILINGWGNGFYQQNAASICNISDHAGPQYKWLTLTLNGEREINEAWAARGGGWGDSVTDEGWKGFRAHLGTARSDLTAAWNLQPNWPMAPDLMITVSLGESGLDEMRMWFDRTTKAQIDYEPAWRELRWGLRPRWYGNEKAMLALGVAAINTGRFDTDVPRKYIDSIYDVEAEMGLPAGKHIFGREDIWPNLARMYDGYVTAPSQKEYWNGWRTSYALIAYFAGKYDVARTQLEALDWKPQQSNLDDWSVDLSLMPLEVAARTGPLRLKVTEAERARDFGDFSRALTEYTALKDAPNADDRTRDFIERRLSELAAEKKLNDGEWISLLPIQDDDPDWVVRSGKVHVLPDGAVQVESGPDGHLLYSRVRAGMNFEVRGQFELVRSANKNFQGGIVMGVPKRSKYDWYGFRLKRHVGEEGDVACFAVGWSRDQIDRHLVLNDVTNTFDMTFQDGKVTASVNGVSIFDNAEPPRQISVPNNSYLIGLGAFTDSPDMVIRYRNVQLKKL